MSDADKRTIVTDALDPNEHRGVIHLVVEFVIAAETLYPGQDVGLLRNGQASPNTEKKLGIVDPFLRGSVRQGDHFWLVFYPGTVTSLRYANEASVDYLKSVAYLKKTAKSLGITFPALIEGATAYVERGEYLVGDENFLFGNIYAEFWDHYEVVTGRSVPEKDRGDFLTLSC